MTKRNHWKPLLEVLFSENFILTSFFALDFCEVIVDSAPGFRGAIFFCAAFFRVTNNGLTESGTTRSL